MSVQVFYFAFPVFYFAFPMYGLRWIQMVLPAYTKSRIFFTDEIHWIAEGKMLTGDLQIYTPSIAYYCCGVHGETSLVSLLKTDLKSWVTGFMERNFLVLNDREGVTRYYQLTLMSKEFWKIPDHQTFSEVQVKASIFHTHTPRVPNSRKSQWV